MNYECLLLSTILRSLFRPTPAKHVPIGSRQAGKTTITRQLEAFMGIPTLYATA